MRPRKEIIEVFSTFVQFEAERWSRWSVDADLRRNMQNCFEQSPDAPVSEVFWSLYWYRLWKKELSALASAHLSAYLQESCYWVAQRSVGKFSKIQCTLKDCFQIAIAEVNTVLQGFNPNKGASLKTYAGMAFLSLLRDILQQSHEASLCSDWTLLHKVSKKRFLEALQQAGLSGDAIAQHRLAWVCFKTIHVRTTPSTPLPKLDRSLWEAIAALYNTERQTQLTTPGASYNSQTIEQRLARCADWIRFYLYPPVQSLNTPKFGQDSSEFQDDLSSTLSESLLSEMIAQEDIQDREAQQVQISTVLIAALEQLDAQLKEALQLYYRQNLRQQQIAEQLGIGQSTVVRRLAKARELLLTSLVQWSQSILNISPTSTLIKDMSLALEEWLRVRYSEPGGLQ